MNVTLKKPEFASKVAAPTSKSAAHRALIAAALADAPSRVRVSGAGADIAATVRCLAALGAKIDEIPADGGNTWLCVTPIGEVTKKRRAGLRRIRLYPALYGAHRGGTWR